ncbi:MAG: site-specific DNA-methyltransferase [Rectinemataceae bacterium]|jgi:adenine-specific DNA-methyltransferase
MRIAKHYEPENQITLFHGDCLDLFHELPDSSARLIVTSPPYNIGKSYEKRLTVDSYVAEQKAVIEECARILQPSGSICWEIGNYVDSGEIIPIDILLYPLFKALGFRLRNRIVWEFGHGLHCSKRFSGRYEVVLWFSKSDDYLFNLDPVRIPQKYPNKKYFKGEKRGQFSSNPLGKNPGDVWDIPNVKSNHIEKTVHPCQFPIELIERLVLSLTDENDLVLDPFMGVGSTAIAALIHNRRAAGAEISAEYVEIAKDRILKAERGELLIRPMERPVYDPTGEKSSIPPRAVSINKSPQLDLLETRQKYGKGEN